MIDLFETARVLQTFCDKQGWRSCFIGGIAVQRWGEPRVTRDVDLTLLTGFGSEDDFLDPLLAAYQARVENAGEFARRYRVLLLKSPTGVGIDISLGALPFEEALVRHATTFSIGPGIEIRTCSAEDLIVLKLFASRPWIYMMPKAWRYGRRPASTGIISKSGYAPWLKLKSNLRYFES
jgi:hypothetical protein